MSGASDERVRTGVRGLTVDDAGELLTLQLAAWVIEAHANQTLAIPALHETVDDVRQQLGNPALNIFGLFEHGRLLATARSQILESGIGFIGRLAVVPDLHGQGLGSAMLRRAEADLPTSVGTIELVTGIRSTANHAFYRRHGYEQTGVDEMVGVALFCKHR